MSDRNYRDLRSLRDATARRRRAEIDWKAEIIGAHARGTASLRQIAVAAGVSHVRVLQIVRGETEPARGKART